jgi:hypothetical protein
VDEIKTTSIQLRRLPVELAAPSGAAFFLSQSWTNKARVFLVDLSPLQGLTGGSALG